MIPRAIKTVLLFFVQVEAVQLIADGKAPHITQPEEGATYEGIQKKENAEVVLATVCLWPKVWLWFMI